MGYSTNRIASETIAGTTYIYTYDTIGNITAISKPAANNGSIQLYSYEYDSLNQLTFVHDYINSKTYSYTYDIGGNILSETINTLDSNNNITNTDTVNYGYSDTNWKDKLTSYDGQTITYDAIGNPLSYRDGMTMTWQNGRELATLQDGSNTISYSYDNAGVRVSKTVNGVDYKYVYLGNLLLFEQRGDMKFYYSYDANGTLYSVKYTTNAAGDNLLTYYFTHNSRGDIVGIYTGNGELRAKYEYDAWGNVISIKDQTGVAPASPTHIGYLNPFRYRGYYLDTETGMYYLMSRYYDPVTHRFLNADGYFQSGGDILDTNMSAYCANNPVNCADYKGNHYCCNPTCVICRPSYREFINSNIEWYNRVTGSNLIKIADNGTFIYKEATSLSNNYVDYNQYSSVIISDNRNGTENPNIRIYDSYVITDYCDQKAIIVALLEYDKENPSSPKRWGRSEASLLSEWDAHNCAYNMLPFSQNHTKDVDLDYDDENNAVYRTFFWR